MHSRIRFFNKTDSWEYAHEFIAAPHTGAVVSIGSLSDVANAIGFVGAVRPYPAVADEERGLVRMARNRLHRPLLNDGTKAFLD